MNMPSARTPHIVVIGAGITGAIAAGHLAGTGAEVTLVSARPGSTIMHAGPWALGREALGQIRPALAEVMPDALEAIQAALPELALEAAAGPYVDVEGVSWRGEWAPATHRAQAQLPEGYAVVDLAPLGQPFATLVNFESGCPVLTVDWPAEGCFGRSFAWAAGRVDADEGAFDALVQALTAAISKAPGSISGLLLPPIAGLRQPAETLKRLQAQVGLPLAEAVGGTPSTPGLRLHMALDRWIASLPVQRIQGEVSRVDASPLTVHLPDQTLSPDAVIVATGGVIPGGLRELEEGMCEPLTEVHLTPKLPVNPLEAAAPEGPWGGPLFRVGVPTDADLRLIHPNGEPLHPCLFAAGDLLAAGDAVVSGWASGLCLASGWFAAQKALKATALEVS
ncbi:MAG: hypothetical protein ACE366_06900 [Bradymonadia bacterium]